MNELSFILPRSLAESADTEGIMALNAKTSPRGLALTREQAAELAQVKSRALRDNSRVEVGVGAAAKLIERFSQSAYAEQGSWAELLAALWELFYFVKTEVHDGISDNALVSFMYERFDERCGGSVELLSDECERLITRLNGGSLEEDD